MYRRKNQDQEWPAWSPGQWPKKQKSGKGGGKDGGKKAAESAPVVRAYDSDGSSTMYSRSSAAGSTQLDAGVQDFFKEFMEAAKSIGQPIPEKLKSMMPNTDREEIKSQQRRLNKLRSLRNRIEAKERSLKQDETQWDAWLKEIKESIHAQKKKHEEAQERMELELQNLRKEEEDLKNGV